MTVGKSSSSYQKAMELTESGKYQEALYSIKEHLRVEPNDAQALNDAAVLLHCLGRSGEAVDYLVQAKNICGDCAEILWNLAEAYLAEERAEEVVELFDDMERMGILNVDLFNRTANVFLNQGDKTRAIEVLLQSLQLWPNQKILEPMIEVIRSQRPKIAFFSEVTGQEQCLSDIYDFVNRRFSVKVFEGRNVDQMFEMMQWCDIAWFECCTDMAIEISKLPKVCKNIVRLCHFEAHDNWQSQAGRPARRAGQEQARLRRAAPDQTCLRQVQWENIDILITVSSSFIKEVLFKQVPNIENRTRLVTITSGVNLDKFQFVKKERGKNLASIGCLDVRKNPMFLLQCMQKLHYIDPEYKLYFAGSFQSPILHRYVEYMVGVLGLTDVVFFDGWQKDVNEWLRDKHYIVSGSIGESRGIGLLEGIACGLKPVIHNFPEACEIFPKEFLFDISEQFCEQILSNSYEPERYRRFVEENYPLKNQLNKINSIFSQLEAEMDLQKNESQFYNSLENEDYKLFTKPSSSSFGNGEAY